MATLTMAICSSSPFTPIPLRYSNLNAAFCNIVQGRHCVALCVSQEESYQRLFVNQSRGRDHRSILKPICAVGSVLETTITDLDESTLRFKKIEIAVDSQDANKLKLRVKLAGEETQKAFDVVLSNIARSAPLPPGSRLQKAGKSSKATNMLLEVLGKDRVKKYVIQRIITSSVTKYVAKKNLTVKDDKISTTQTEDKLQESFLPGSEFEFNVELELVKEGRN